MPRTCYASTTHHAPRTTHHAPRATRHAPRTCHACTVQVAAFVMTLRRRGLISHAQDLGLYASLLGLGLLRRLEYLGAAEGLQPRDQGCGPDMRGCSLRCTGLQPGCTGLQPGCTGLQPLQLARRLARRPLRVWRARRAVRGAHRRQLRGPGAARPRRQQVRAVVRGGDGAPMALRAPARHLARVATPRTLERRPARGERVAAWAARAVDAYVKAGLQNCSACPQSFAPRSKLRR